MERDDISASDRKQIDDHVRKGTALLKSKEGREGLQASLKEAREFGQRLTRARRVDLSKLRQPMTI